MNDELIELMASFMHEQWSNFMKDFYKEMSRPKGKILFRTENERNPETYVFDLYKDYWRHWRNLMNLPYKYEFNPEKNSYKEQAKKLLELLKKDFAIIPYCNEELTPEQLKIAEQIDKDVAAGKYDDKKLSKGKI